MNGWRPSDEACFPPFMKGTLMKDVVLLYDDCCIYEIVILNYFLKVTGSDLVFCSLDEKAIKVTEGYSILPDAALKNIDLSEIRSFIIPGGDISHIDQDIVYDSLKSLHNTNVLIAGICAGVDVLEKAGLLDGIRSSHMEEYDCVLDKNILTARANAYVDFAIEAAKALDIFEDEADLQETIAFWKEFKRAL